MKHFCFPFLFVVLLGGAYTHAQDITFSQPFVNQLIYNPATTAIGGGTTVGSNYRMQWPAIGSPAATRLNYNYQAVAGAVDIPCIKSAIGMYFLRGNEGIVEIESQTVGVSLRFRPFEWLYSWHSDSKLDVGLAFSSNWLEANFNNAIFSDQLDPFDGLTGPTMAPIPGNRITGHNYFDLGAGLLYSRTWGGSNQERNGIRVGMVYNHLVRADHSLMGRDDTTSLLYGIHLSYYMGKRWKQEGERMNFQLVPMFRYFTQKPSTRSHRDRYELLEFGFGANLKKAPGLFGSIMHRSRLFYRSPGQDLHSLIFMFGWEFEGFQSTKNLYRISFSYDYNYAGLRSDSNGSLEFGLTVHFTESSLFNNCPAIRAPWDPCNRIF